MAEPSHLSPALAKALTGVFEAPAFVLPWIDRFLEPLELEVVAALADGPLTVVQAAGRLSSQVSPAFFERAYRRGVIDRPTPDLVAPAGFHARLEIWAMFEGWKDVPPEVRTALLEWDLAHYVEERREQIAAVRAGEAPQAGLDNSEYLLLHEAEALLARAEHVYLWPCDCRAIAGRCTKPLSVCLRFSNDRGLGWEISRERAVEVVREADRAGLMHTGEAAGLVPDSLQPTAICNCCRDCCYPQLAADRLGTQGVWPHSRYVADLHRDLCTGCGRCVRRCPFAAFTLAAERGRRAADEVRRPRSAADILFDPARCRGCGLCATGCPENAVAMTPLPTAPEASLRDRAEVTDGAAASAPSARGNDGRSRRP